MRTRESPEDPLPKSARLHYSAILPRCSNMNRVSSSSSPHSRVGLLRELARSALEAGYRRRITESRKVPGRRGGSSKFRAELASEYSRCSEYWKPDPTGRDAERAPFQGIDQALLAPCRLRFPVHATDERARLLAGLLVTTCRTSAAFDRPLRFPRAESANLLPASELT
jgi:hypothetical protein